MTQPMIEAMVSTGEADSAWGTFGFDVLPSRGDHLVVGNVRGSSDILVVDYVEHHPVKMPSSAYARQTPRVSIVAHYYGSFGD